MTLQTFRKDNGSGKGKGKEKSGEQGHIKNEIQFDIPTIRALTKTWLDFNRDDGLFIRGTLEKAGEKIKNVVFDPDNPKLIEAFTGISESDHDKDAASKALQQKAAENFKNLFIYPTKCFPISEPFGRMDLISKLTKECGIEKAEAEKITIQLITGKHIVLPNGKKLLCTRLPFTDTAPKYWFEIQ